MDSDFAEKMLMDHGRYPKQFSSMMRAIRYARRISYNTARKINLGVHKFAHMAQSIVKDRVEACNYFLSTL